MRNWTSLGFFLLAGLCLLISAVIFQRELRDPRWRDFDFSSRQSTFNEVYFPTEIPALTDVRRIDELTLEFRFDPPVATSSWEVQWTNIRAPSEDPVVQRVEGRHPRVTFPDNNSRLSVSFEPEDVTLTPPIRAEIGLAHSGIYEDQGLSVPDNFWFISFSHPVSLAKRWSVADFVGLAPDDSDLEIAREYLDGRIDPEASTLEKIEAVGLLTWELSWIGIPDDETQDAAPVEVLQAMARDESQGWCEDWALVYYILANAAGIPTRLVDNAGFVGAQKLCGHYYNETWVEELGQWAYVDVHQRVLYLHNEDRTKVFNTYEITRLIRMGELSGIKWTGIRSPHRTHGNDYPEEPTIYTTGIEDVTLPNSLASQGVIAYKFGYPRNTNHSTLHTYLFKPTLLLSEFQPPRYLLLRNALLHGIWLFAILGLVIRFVPVGRMSGTGSAPVKEEPEIDHDPARPPNG